MDALMRRLFLLGAFVLVAPAYGPVLRAQSDRDHVDVLKAALAHEISSSATDRLARSRIMIDPSTAKACNDRVCDWYSVGAKLPPTVQAFVTDSLGAGVRNRDDTYFCDDMPAHFGQFMNNANAFVRVTEPVIRGDTALVGVNWYRSTRQPLAIAGQVSMLVRKAGKWTFERITFEWM
jgi:hypothetical protein